MAGHLIDCARCARDYRIFLLSRTVLDAAGLKESIELDKTYFAALRAKIARGPETGRTSEAGDESWAVVLLLASRQLIPAMGMLLLLILGATLLLDPRSTGNGGSAVRPSDRVMLGDLYEYRPTPDDVLETLVAVEDKENGK
jgi:hypothetical protein